MAGPGKPAMEVTKTDADIIWSLNMIDECGVFPHNITSSSVLIAGDNLFTGDLSGFGARCRETQTPVLGVYDVGSLEEATKYGVVAVGDAGQISSFEEKPAQPQSTLIGIALYFYPRAALAEIRRYIAEGNNPDQPGRLIQWLYPQQPVHTWKVPGDWLDIGSKETLEAADALFRSPDA